MFEHWLLLPLAVTAVYLVVWGYYRYFRYLEHRKYRREHAEERLRRAEFDARNLSNGYPVLDGEETHRRANWDVVWGPLMSPLELKNREESRWPVGAALQVATSIFSGLVIALLIWGARPGAHDSGSGNYGGSGNSVSSFEMGERAGKSNQVVTPPPAAPDPVFPYVFLFVIASLASGSILLFRSGSWQTKALGVGLLATAPFVSGVKFALIEKAEIKPPDISIKLPGKTAPPPLPFSFSMTLPSFPSGSAEPDDNLRCVLHTLARDLSRDTELSSIVVIGRADKRELKPQVRRKYASNWALAQQRGVCVRQVFLQQRIDPNKVTVNTAGPLNTAGPTSNDLLGMDRSVTILVGGSGANHPWAKDLTQGVALSKCEPNAVVADDPCQRI